MEDTERIKEVCDLLKIWFHFKTSGEQWKVAKLALEARINFLMEGCQ